MSKEFTASSKSNPCPVCGRTKDGDCRIKEQGNLVLCHTHRDDIGITNGYKFLHDSDKGAGWGVWVWNDDKGVKEPRPSIEKLFYYQSRKTGKNIVAVKRRGNPKQFSQHGILLGGRLSNGIDKVNRDEIGLYRLADVKEAIARGHKIYWCEGEGTADAIAALGLCSTTTIGGCEGLNRYGNPQLYLEDLDGASMVCLVPDRDHKGLEYIDKVGRLLSSKGIEHRTIKVFPDSPLWSHLPQTGGLDAEDWIKDGATVESFLSQAVNVLPHSEKKTDIISELRAIITGAVRGINLDSELINLSSKYRVSKDTLRELYEKVDKEIDSVESRESRTAETLKLINFDKDPVKVTEILKPELANPLIQLGKNFNVDPLVYLTLLLPTVASLIPPNTEALVMEGTDFRVKPIFWAGLIAPSGSKKTPLHKSIIGPLEAMQNSESQRFVQELEDYERDMEQWKGAKKGEKGEKPKAPIERRYMVSDFTLEGVARVIKENNHRGLLMEAPELNKVFKGLNQYKLSGSDVEKFLELRDGGTLNITRAQAEKSIYCPNTQVSVVGGIQPDILNPLIEKGDGNGLFSRFCWHNLPKRHSPFIRAARVELSGLLTGIYKKISQFSPMFFTLDDEASLLYEQWYNYADDKRVAENHGGLSSVFSKSQGWAGEICLILHCLNAAIEGHPPSPKINAATVKAAINATQFYLNQAELVYSECGAAKDELSPHCAKIVRKCDGKTVTITDISHLYSGATRPKAYALREYMAELEEMGFAQRVDNKRWKIRSKPLRKQPVEPPKEEPKPQIIEDSEPEYVDTLKVGDDVSIDQPGEEFPPQGKYLGLLPGVIAVDADGDEWPAHRVQVGNRILTIAQNLIRPPD